MKSERKAPVLGMRFGRLRVLAEAPPRNSRRYWRCVCDCGRECVVEEYHLKSGHTKSCGCYRREVPKGKRLDLTGQRYGRLLVLGPVPSKDGEADYIYWDCLCDCGNRCICHKENLRGGNTQSCGCLREEQRKENMRKNIHFVDGTCIEKIACQKENAANTSGHRGVYRRENGKWRASIEFRGKRYNLGTFMTFEEAVAARQEGERMYQDFLDAYYASAK
ncbi:MAG: hypothetical protein LUE24_02295 [Lachnospiraceae bacterium]|nr:hypothetical protein [Lachnospiraceae bacterium]